jgi:hypothetical protein
MEGLGKKIKNGLMYTAFLAGIGVAAEHLPKAAETNVDKAKASSTGVNKTEDVTGTVYTNADGQVVNAKKQTNEEVQKAWLIASMKTKEYHDRAILEGLSEQDIQDRIDRVENTPIFKKSGSKLDGAGATGADGATNILTNGKVVSVDISKDGDSEGATAKVHEGQHTATSGDINMTNTAKDMYKNSFVGDGNTPYASNPKYEGYLKEYTERDARKKQLQYEAEQMGIVKYTDHFTQEDYQKIMDAYNQGKFTYGARQFIETTKPEYFIKIMNSVAQDQEIQNHNDAPPYNLPTEQQG